MESLKLRGLLIRQERLNHSLSLVVASFTDEHLAQAVKIVGVSDDLDLVADCEKVAQRILGRTASAARSQSYYLDVTHPKANKGTVVTTLSKFFDIRPDQIATIGEYRVFQAA